MASPKLALLWKIQITCLSDTNVVRQPEMSRGGIPLLGPIWVIEVGFIFKSRWLLHQIRLLLNWQSGLCIMSIENICYDKYSDFNTFFRSFYWRAKEWSWVRPQIPPGTKQIPLSSDSCQSGKSRPTVWPPLSIFEHKHTLFRVFLHFYCQPVDIAKGIVTIWMDNIMMIITKNQENYHL